MSGSALTDPAEPTRWFRRFLLGVAAAVYAGAAVELVLVDHYEDWKQLVPFVVIVLGLGTSAWLASSPGASAVRAVRVVAGLAVAAAGVGVGLHLWGNLEFVREVNAGAGFAEALWDALSGGNPLLAPGMVALAGVLAAAATYRWDRPARA